MAGLRVGRLEIDELWQYVGKKQKNVTREDGDALGDQWTFIALGSSSKAIVSYMTGKRNGETTFQFIRDLRERVIGAPEISSDGLRYYGPAIREAFGNKVAYGKITKTYSVTHLAKKAGGRYSPAQVIAVDREVVSGVPAEISTSYVERSHLTLRMSSKRFARLSNGFSKRLEHHSAAVSLYVAYYNFCRPHEAHRTTPAVALGLSDHVWSVGELLDAATKKAPPKRKRFQVIDGDRSF
jgi:IS1 family transposase